MRRPAGHYVVIALFVAIAANALNEVREGLSSGGSMPAPLAGLQLLTGTLSVAAAYAVIRRRRWSTIVIAAWGIAAAGMAVLLGPILDLPPDARPGLLGRAAMIIAIAICSAWYVRRDANSPPD